MGLYASAPSWRSKDWRLAANIPLLCYAQKDHLEKAPHAFIAVHVVDALPIARQVNVEPCTADDWELIQLHAGSIEVELLRQVLG